MTQDTPSTQQEPAPHKPASPTPYSAQSNSAQSITPHTNSPSAHSTLTPTIDGSLSSPVVKPTTIRTVLSLALSHNWLVHQLNVKNAFHNADLSETIYMYQPPGFMDPIFPHHVCRLQRSLYGLKHAPRAWFQRFAGYTVRVGFSSSRCDSSLFISRHGSEVAYLSIYVDDILLDWAHVASCNPTRTPVDTESKLGADGDPVFDLTLYRSLVGGLQYLTFTRPDISYAVQQGDNILSWSSKQQHTLSRSSAEAEYRDVANAVAETEWIHNLLHELHTTVSSATIVYCDNVSAIYMTSNPV
ncbi:ribonuclease H-like domain-containing protein [Tanacetum coccineum]